MKEDQYLLVNSAILPPVYERVLLAKELLATGKAQSAAAAAREAGISRTAFYKYKDFVFKYSGNSDSMMQLEVILSDKAGIFSALTTALYSFGVNIITVSQEMPKDGTARVMMTISTENLNISTKELIIQLTNVDGVLSLKQINGGIK